VLADQGIRGCVVKKHASTLPGIQDRGAICAEAIEPRNH
jgi:hypothetical protein